MYQINPTEMFRERHLVLLREADNRRLRAAKQNTEAKIMGRLRRTALLFGAVVMVLVISATAALAEIRVGTGNAETIVGTNASDHITGNGGDDTLKGLARNDVYHFDDGFGHDTVTESAFVKAGKKKLPGGSDTLSFVGMSGSGVEVNLIPQWVSIDPYYNRVSERTFGTSNIVELGASPIENVVGSPNGDSISVGSSGDTLSGGPGGSDWLMDWGGCSPSEEFHCKSPLPASNDSYLGFAGGPAGVDHVYDYGGTADRLDLRPLRSSEVHFDAYDDDGSGEHDSLSIFIDATHQVTVMGHLAPHPDIEDGRIEQIIFSDETITSAAELKSLM